MATFKHKRESGIPSKDGNDHDVMDLSDTDQATGDTAATTALQQYLKYVDAVALSSHYHMEVDLESIAVAAVPAFVDSAAPTTPEKAALYARTNLLKTAMLAHMAGVGTRTVDGEHLAAETSIATTLTAVPAATTVGTACTLAIALGVAVVAHGNSTGKHFHDDTSAESGSGYTASSDLLIANATAEKCRVEVNALRDAMATHFDDGIA